jgi:hypothetical protein
LPDGICPEQILWGFEKLEHGHKLLVVKQFTDLPYCVRVRKEILPSLLVALERFLNLFEDSNESFFLLHREDDGFLSRDSPDDLGNVLEIAGVAQSLKKNTYPRVRDFFWILYRVDIVLTTLSQYVQNNLLWYISTFRTFQPRKEFLKLQK